ncbi:hypothetical protein Kazakh3189_12070 [Helicobacter pylori]
MESVKQNFIEKLKVFATELTGHVTTQLRDWKIKGFININIDKNIYTISPDTKIISKVLEIQLFPKFKTFAKKNGYEIIIAEK